MSCKRKDLEFVEKKGCMTFSKICVNLGKRADLETGREKYFCVRDFPENCSRFGCPKLMPMSDPKRWQLRTLSESELKTLREFSEEVKQKKWRRRAEADKAKAEAACKEVGCSEDMYCFGGKDETVNPRLCEDARKVMREKETKKN